MTEPALANCGITIEEHTLHVTLPTDRIGLVMMQPFVELNDREPFVWLPDRKANQIERILRTLDISEENRHGAQKTHFTVFPEYSLPGLDAVRAVNRRVCARSWPNGTFVLGGVDGLKHSEYETLCTEPGTTVSPANRPDKVQTHEWVNCYVLWARDDAGAVGRWVQPKLAASVPEENAIHRYLYAGKTVDLYAAKLADGMPCFFIALVCYDWMGRLGQHDGIRAVLHQIEGVLAKRDGQIDLSFAFVIQRNQKPSYHEFLSATRDFFADQRYCARVRRYNCMVVLPNAAGRPTPGKSPEFGQSSLIFRPQAPFLSEACPPTYATDTRIRRGSSELGKCLDVLFREGGGCVHSFALRPPAYVNLDPSDRTLPLLQPWVFPLDAGMSDPRVPGAPVPASVKWVNDELDDMPQVLTGDATCPQSVIGALTRSKSAVAVMISSQPGPFLLDFILSSSPRLSEDRSRPSEKRRKWIKAGAKDVENVDRWDASETKCLETVVNSLTIVNVASPITIGGDEEFVSHATTIGGDGTVFDVLVIDGPSHIDCRKHADQVYVGNAQKRLILVTKDRDNSTLQDRDRSILSPQVVSGSIMDPVGSQRHVSYQDFISACRGAADEVDLVSRISRLILN
jgi:hypothetical protein